MVFDSSLPPLRDSAYPFITSAWKALLERYPGDLGTICSSILTFGCRLGCTTRPTDRRTPNHCIEEPSLITQKLPDDLFSRQVQLSTVPVVVSPLGLVPKHDGGWRRIHDLSYHPGRSVNESIPDSASAIQYISIDNIFDLIRTSPRRCYIIKRDIKDAFRNIPVAPADRPLLAFRWDNKTYMECRLPFGLTTAPFIFNLFAEGLNRLLTAYLPLASIVHYLDDFIAIFPSSVGGLCKALAAFNSVYIPLTDALGIPRNDSKDTAGTFQCPWGRNRHDTFAGPHAPR
jgi:hypothetical protein